MTTRQIAGLLEGLIPLLGGMYGLMLVRTKANDPKWADWNKRFGGFLKVGGPLLILFGLWTMAAPFVQKEPVPSSPPAAPPRFETPEALIAYLAEEARDIAKKEHQVDLDYSVESIRKVETILGTLHAEYKKNPATPGVRGLASAYGAYVGEAIRRKHPGASWKQDHPTIGEKTYPLTWSGGESFPMAWCYKRITNGDEDNVWHKYVVLREARGENAPAAAPK